MIVLKMGEQKLMDQCLQLVENKIYRAVISKPRNKSEIYKKIVVEKKTNFFQFSKYTEKQVFHENVVSEELAARIYELTEGHFGQINAWSDEYEYYVLISKKGSSTLKKKKVEGQAKKEEDHNRKKNYILEEGTSIPPLVDMGVFTKDGKVVRSMFDKFKQINRFIEMIDDAVRDLRQEELHVIDFGCGKSYLTFILYYYLTEIKKKKATIIGLDLKADVIKHCNEVSQKYGYDGLRFELGDINGYQAPFDVDMVITLHACDTATDFALYNAICWNAKMIFSVPCCQHELNGQMEIETLHILGEYGIIKERFAALATDAIRGKLLEASGYKTQLLEFIDLSHTPKNILIRAIKKPVMPKNIADKSIREVEQLMKEFHFEPTLYRLLQDRK